MAPELALRRLPRPHPRGRKKVVLDPMMGSGTIPVMAALRGYQAIGFDIDPLALLIARTWGRPLKVEGYVSVADAVVESARRSRLSRFRSDSETEAFVDYWFDCEAKAKLVKLAASIEAAPDRYRAALWCAFSRLIITKDASVSLARDVSHSRPHRVRDKALVDPLTRFPAAARNIARRHARLAADRPAAKLLRLGKGDARALPLDDRSVDFAMTSPPYLNAIDYLRGHRLSLVWMGYRLGELRELRAEAIGSERGHWENSELEPVLQGVVAPNISDRAKALLLRYALDLDDVLAEQARILRRDGRLTLVVADGVLVGTPVRVARLCVQVARRHGFRVTSRRSRDLPSARRYLPPPLAGSKGDLHRRMRVETALTFALGRSRGVG